MVIAFYRGSGIGAWAVRTFCRSPWGHCAVVQGQTVVEATVAGVMWRTWGSHPADGAIGNVLVAVPGTTATGEDRAGQFLIQQSCRPYDWLGIALDVFAKFIRFPRFMTDQTRKRWTCRRLAAFACALAGWQGPAWRVPATPGGLYDALTETR